MNAVEDAVEKAAAQATRDGQSMEDFLSNGLWQTVFEVMDKEYFWFITKSTTSYSCSLQLKIDFMIQNSIKFFKEQWW